MSEGAIQKHRPEALEANTESKKYVYLFILGILVPVYVRPSKKKKHVSHPGFSKGGRGAFYFLFFISRWPPFFVKNVKYPLFFLLLKYTKHK